MDNREAIHKLESMRNICQKLIDEKVKFERLVGTDVTETWNAETPFDDTCQNLIEALNLAIAALEQQERDSWHAIAKDGLPKKDGDYLVCYEEGYREDYSLDEIGIAPFEVDCEGFGIWVERFDKYTLGSLGSDWTEIKATAWMPLPEQYKAEEKDG